MTCFGEKPTLIIYYYSNVEQKAAEKQNKLAEIMEKQASTVCTTKASQQKSDGEIKRLLVAQYGHESDEEL